MRHKWILSGILWAVMITLAVPQASAQSFSAIIEKLDQLEARLNQLEKVQKKDIQELQSLLSQVQPGAPGQDMSGLSKSVGDMETSMSAVQSKLTQISHDVEQLKTTSYSWDAEAVNSMTTQLRELIAELRTTLASGSAGPSSSESKLASAEPMIASRQGAVYLSEEKPKGGTEPLLVSRGEPAAPTPEKLGKPAETPPPAESSAKLKIPSMKVYGFVRLEAIYDNTEVARGDWLLYANKGGSPQMDQSVMTMTARHSRLGVEIGGPSVGTDGKTKGVVEVDFAGGFPNSSTAARQPQLRLRIAWVELNYPMWEARFGQDWALIATPHPNTTSFVVGAGMGNLWQHIPQMCFSLKPNPVKLSLSINRPMAGNVKYESYTGGDLDPIDDGERSALPWIMGKCGLKLKPATFSISGHYGLEQINDLSAKPHDMPSYSINADAQVTAGPVAFTTRGFYGENLNTFFGGIFQGYTSDSSSVSNIASLGGWAQVVYTISKSWAATLGT
ncbi:MAG: hypothetical protein FJY66_01000, partial [Calditrichaeota bacterium]|nr:hypothetical protein [Calditrichota bacterium]